MKRVRCNTPQVATLISSVVLICAAFVGCGEEPTDTEIASEPLPEMDSVHERESSIPEGIRIMVVAEGGVVGKLDASLPQTPENIVCVYLFNLRALAITLDSTNADNTDLRILQLRGLSRHIGDYIQPMWVAADQTELATIVAEHQAELAEATNLIESNLDRIENNPSMREALEGAIEFDFLHLPPDPVPPPE